MKPCKKTISLFLILALMMSLLSGFALAADPAPDGGVDPGAAPTGTIPDGTMPDGGMGDIPGGDGGPGGPGGPGEPGMGGAPGASAVSSGAKSITELTDFGSVTQKEAVEMLLVLGIINGFEEEDGTYTYRPNELVSRAAMAKLIATAMELVNGGEISGAADFSDVPADGWAYKYIGYCAENDILDGLGGGVFDPQGSVTGTQTAKMLIAAMGYDSLTGSGWADKVQSIASELGLYEGLDSLGDDPITRDQAACLIYNALLLSTGDGPLPKLIAVMITTQTDSFTVGDNTVVAAGEGKAVTLTADGVNYPIEPGINLTGNIVLNVTEYIDDVYYDHGNPSPQTMTAALYIDDDGISANQSVTAALSGGSYDASGAKDIKITSYSDYFGGIRIGGSAVYTIDNCEFDFTGNGGNDFTGIGVPVSAVDNAVVTIKNSKIKTSGALRGSIFTGDNAKIIVEDTTITTESVYNEDGSLASVSIPTAGMASPPTGLGVAGNNRASNLVNSANAEYRRCIINSDSWGAMGTDDVSATAESPVYLDMYECEINIGGAGYGAYAIGYIWDRFYNCKINADHGMGIIVAAEGSTLVDQGTVVTSNRFGIVTHQGMGAVSNIVITGGSVINAKYTGIQIKERASRVTVSDGAKISVTDGAMIQALPNDDTGAGSLQGTEIITVDISKTELTGDILDSLPSVPMTVTLDGATITGAVSTAAHTFLSPTVSDARDVGIVTGNELISVEGCSLALELKNNSVWTAVKESYLTSLTVDATSKITGTITVDSAAVSPEAGVTYTGNIVVSPLG